jgi:hypothetical protein
MAPTPKEADEVWSTAKHGSAKVDPVKGKWQHVDSRISLPYCRSKLVAAVLLLSLHMADRFSVAVRFLILLWRLSVLNIKANGFTH